MDAPLAKTRLLPPRVHRAWVERRRLLDRLDRAQDVPLTLVVAPSGFGKTGFVAQWAASHPGAVAWLTLDERDDDLVAFVTLFAAAVNAAVPGAIVSPQRYFDFAGDAPDPAVAAAHVLNDLSDLAADLAIVVDDVHLLSDSGPNAVLEAIARAGIPGLRLIAVSRSAPPWNLAPLRASGRIEEIRGGDLRLTVAEVAGYARNAGWADISPQDADTIHAVSQGWLTAVRFLSAAPERLREHADEVSEVNPGRSAEAMAWLLGEALAAMPPHDRDLLLRLAVPARVNRSLAEALGAGVCPPEERKAIYARLVDDGLFLSRPDAERWSALHAQVREAMLALLEPVAGPGGMAWLHATARDWFLAHGMHDEAIGHAWLAGGAEDAARVVRIAIRPALVGERWHEIERWIAALPPKLLHDDPELLLGLAWAAYYRDDVVATQALIAEARALLDSRDGEDWRVLALEADALGAAAAFFTGRLDEAERLSGRAIAGLPPDRFLALSNAYTIHLIARSTLDPASADGEIAAAIAAAASLPPEVAAHLWSILAIMTFRQGDLRKTLRLCERVRGMEGASRAVFAASWADSLAAISSYLLDDLEAAVAHATVLLGRAGPAHRVAVREALFTLSLAYEAKGQPDEADLTVNRLEELMLARGGLNEMSLVAALRAMLALLRGDAAAARAWHAATTGEPVLHATNSLIDEPVVHAAIAIELGIDPSGGLAAIEELIASPAAGSTLTWRTGLLALAAIARHRLGDTAGAREAISEALRDAAPFGFVRPFLDRGSALDPVLALAAADPALAGQAAALRAALAAERPLHRQVPAADPRDDGKPLSERELEVLELLGQRLSNKEIGSALRISPLTVKRHTINIYAKLGVGSRRQAIQRARETGLVDAAAAQPAAGAG